MLCKCFLLKANGRKNPQIGPKVMNFILALSVHDKKAFNFVLANLHSVGHQWIKLNAATRCTPPFIGLTEPQVIEMITCRCDILI